MTYNIPEMGNFTKIMEFSSDVTSGAFGPVTLAVIFFISFLALKGYSADKAFGFAAYITSIISLLMGMLGILPQIFGFGFFFVLAGVGTVWIYLANKKSSA